MRIEGIKDSRTDDWVRDYLNVDNLNYMGTGIDIAIIDTGYDPSITCLEHIDVNNTVDFTGPESEKIIAELDKIQDTEKKIEHIKNSNSWTRVTADPNKKYHGSNMAAIIGAQLTDNGDNLEGIAPGANLHILKIYHTPEDGLTCNCSIASQHLPTAILWCVANNIHLVNISQTVGSCSTMLHNAIREAYHNDVILVCAAGNTPTSVIESVEFPAAFQKTLAIGSFAENGAIDSSTDRGALLDFVLPGKDVKSFIDPENLTLSGSSISCALATAVLALYLEKEGPRLSYYELKKRLILKAVRLSKDSHNSQWGYGQINPTALISN